MALDEEGMGDDEDLALSGEQNKPLVQDNSSRCKFVTVGFKHRRSAAASRSSGT